MCCTQNLPLTQKFPNIDEDFLQHTRAIGSRLRVIKCKGFGNFARKYRTNNNLKSFSTSMQCSVPILLTAKWMLVLNCPIIGSKLLRDYEFYNAIYCKSSRNKNQIELDPDQE